MRAQVRDLRPGLPDAADLGVLDDLRQRHGQVLSLTALQRLHLGMHAFIWPVRLTGIQLAIDRVQQEMSRQPAGDQVSDNIHTKNPGQVIMPFQILSFDKNIKLRQKGPPTLLA